MICASCVLGAVSCENGTEIRTQGRSLGEIEVSADEGFRSVAITTDGVWYVGEADSADWVSFDDTVGRDNGAFTVFYEANKSDLSETRLKRMARIVVSTADKYTADTLYLKQYGAPAVLRFRSSEVEVGAAGGTLSVEVSSNIPAAESRRIKVSADAAWIRNLSFDGISQVRFAAVATSEGRRGTITISFIDGWGDMCSSSIDVIQKAEGGL